MKTSRILLILSLVYNGFSAHSQNTPVARNSVYLEGFGNAVLYSINYERIFKAKENFLLAGRIGISYAPPPEMGPGALVELNFLLGPGNHHFELGAGSTYYYLYSKDDLIDPNINLLLITTRIGYRYQKRDGGFLFRTGLLPFFIINVDEDIIRFERNFLLFGGVSFGYTFKNKVRE